jgi:transposase
MSSEINCLRREVMQLRKENELLKARDQRRSVQERTVTEGWKARDDFLRFLLRFAQGHLTLDMLIDHLGESTSTAELVALHDESLNGPPHLSRRAQAVILHLYGVKIRAIMEFLWISRNTVKRYISWYESGGSARLLKARHLGVVRQADNPEIREALLSTLHCPPSEFGHNRTSWTIKLLKAQLSADGHHVSQNAISEILRNSGYRMWKAKEVLTSNDPDYKAKVAVVTGILARLKPDERFFSVDEFGPLAIKKRVGRRFVKDGERPVIPQFQRSKGTLTMTAALELSTNQVTHFYSPAKNSGETIKLLRLLTKRYEDARTLFITWDSASWHRSKAVFDEVRAINAAAENRKKKSPRVYIAPLPSRAQFLNVIESVFSGMASAIIQNSDYQSVGAARKAIDRYFRERNQHFRENPKRAGGKIWGKELVTSEFREGQNCKNPRWR